MASDKPRWTQPPRWRCAMGSVSFGGELRQCRRAADEPIAVMVARSCLRMALGVEFAATARGSMPGNSEADAIRSRPASTTRPCKRQPRARAHQGGPRHAVGVAIEFSAGRSAATCCNTRQRPILQCGQQSISMAATRRMKASAWQSRASIEAHRIGALAKAGRVLERLARFGQRTTSALTRRA